MEIGGRALTWCTNLFPSGDLEELLALVRGPAVRVKEELRRTGPMGLGLWLPGEVAACLARLPAAAQSLEEALAEGGFYLQAVNAFPMGRFHGEPVKQAVYRPDWAAPERLAYTLDALRGAARLARPGSCLSLSTPPLGLAGAGPRWERACAAGLLQAAAAAAALEKAHGVELVLALEPEPGCRLERGDQAAEWLAREALRLEDADARIWGRHLGLCLDACHMAVLGEDPAEALAAARALGVRVARLQLSSALELSPLTEEGLLALESFAEPIYCHQTSCLDPRGRLLRSFADLEEALRALRHWPGEAAALLRTHFHVPLFWTGRGPLRGTAAGQIPGLLARSELLPEVLEVETYTWSILPAGLGELDLASGVAKELRWVLERLEHAS